MRLSEAAHSSASTPSSTNPMTDRSERPQTMASQESSDNRTERARSKRTDEPDVEPDNQRTTVRNHSHESATMTPEMLLASGMAAQSQTEQPAATTASSSPGAAPTVEATVAEVPSGTAQILPSTDVASTFPAPNASALPSGQASGSVPATATANGTADPSVGQTKGSDASTAEPVNSETVPSAKIQNEDVLGETVSAQNEGSSKQAQTEPDKAKSAIAVIGAHMTVQPASGGKPADPGDLQPKFDSVMQVSDASAAQTTSSAEQFFERDGQSSSASREDTGHPKSNLLSTDDKALRSQFLEQTAGSSPSASMSSDSRVGRGESGQTAVVHASESERINELRSAFPSAQAVTLDLDPLDMGPLRVRILMTDQTVHAHIRTAHGELGQGLLQQGQSLEASLRTTGLEMGMLRVTVDQQQQQGHGENARAFQQQGRAGLASEVPSGSREEERSTPTEQGMYNSGHVSFFA